MTASRENGWTDLGDSFFTMFLMVRSKFTGKKKSEKNLEKLENVGKT